MKVLDKTHYRYYLTCDCYGWHKFHDKLHQQSNKAGQYASNMGEEVEMLAQNLFPAGYQITGNSQQAIKSTHQHINNPQNNVLYQATASNGQLLAKADIITIDHTQKTLNIYEVKSSSDLKLPAISDLTENTDKYFDQLYDNIYMQDIAFQKITFEKSGYRIDKSHLIHINKDYKFTGDIIDIDKLFQIVDVSDAVDLIIKNTESKIDSVLQCYLQKQEPKCQCRHKPKGQRCPDFTQFNPDIPINNSILDINNIRKPKIDKILAKGIVKIMDFDLNNLDDFKFSPKQINQIEALHKQATVIDKGGIQSCLSKLKYPLHFLDYEAINYAIPQFQQATPFQQIPFQFSVHVLKDNQLKHAEYLASEAITESLEELVSQLKKAIHPEGSIIVWHEQAEKTFQKSLVKLMPQHKEFFEDIDNRLFDLEQIFKKQFYIDYRFQGQTRLKTVAGVLAPELSYSKLNIQEGRQASIDWDHALTEMPKKRDKIFKDLLKYCKYDTLTMVEIYKLLKELAESND